MKEQLNRLERGLVREGGVLIEAKPKTPTEVVREQLPREEVLVTPKKKYYLDWRRVVELNEEATKIWKETYPFVEEAIIRPEAEYPNLPILVFFDSDWHLGSIGFAGKKFVEDIDLLQTTPNCFMVTLGDDIDIGMFSDLAHLQGIPKYTQMNTMKQLARELTGANPRERKIWLAACAGNHTMTMFERAGVLYETFFEEADITLFPGMGKIHLMVGNEEYKGAVCHKFHMGRSKLNLPLMGKRLKQFYWSGAEYMLSAHYHEKGVEHFEQGGEDLIAGASGSRRIDEILFELSRGYGHPAEGGICILFDSKKHEMTPYKKLRKGIEVLKMTLRDNGLADSVK